LQHVRGIQSGQTYGVLTDRDLLDRFARGDENAFTTLVRRHGSMVLGVARRVLRQACDADDVFQAAFLALARHVGSRRWQVSVGNWLYVVAYRLALNARAESECRARHEARARLAAPMDPLAVATGRELCAILDEELARLPERLRAPLIGCCLEGQTRDEAARSLGWSLGTLKRRLEQGRTLLRSRLVKRGFTLPATLAGALVAEGLTPAAVPADLVQTVAAAAARGTMPSGRVLSLAQTLISCASFLRLKTAAVVLLAASLIGGLGLALGLNPQLVGWVESSRPTGPTSPEREQAKNTVGLEDSTQPTKKEGTDQHGDALPEGVIARLGTLRWRHEGEAGHLAFSVDGKVLAATNQDGTILLFDTATGKRLCQVKSMADPPRIGPLAFSPDGKYLAWQADYGKVHLWNPKTKQHVRTLTAKDDDPSAPVRFAKISYSPNGKLLAAAAGPDHIAVWDTESGKLVTSLRGHNHCNPPIVFSPDSQTIAVSSKPVVQIFDAHTGKRLRGFDTDQKWALTLAFSPDGKTIATGAESRIVLSDVKSGKETGRLSSPAFRIGGVLDVSFTPDGKSLVSADEDGRVIVWDLGAGKERFVLDSHGWIGRSLALTPDGKTVAVGTVYNVIRLWDVETGKECFTDPPGHDAPVHAVAFSPDGKFLVTGGENRRINVWDAVSGRHLRAIAGMSAKDVSFSPDGKRLAAAWINDANARVWDLATGEELLKVSHDASKGVQAIAFTPDGKKLVSLDRPGAQGAGARVNLWDAATGKRMSQMMTPNVFPHCLALAPDGKLAAVGDQGQPPVRLCDLERGKELTPIPSNQSVVVSAAFSPDGRILATGGGDLTVCLWETASRSLIATLRGHDRTVAAIVFSPDGRLLASADGEPMTPQWKANPSQKIHLWDIVTGKELLQLDGHGSNVTSLAFSPDGKRLVSGLANGTVLIWDMATRVKVSSPAAEGLQEKELELLWSDLAAQDAGKGQIAVWRLSRSPTASVPFIHSRIAPAEAVDKKRVAALIADLDNEQFVVREKASEALLRLEDQGTAELRATHARGQSPETKRRIETILAKLEGAGSPETWRLVRAVQSLEYAGTKEARQLLRRLAAGAPDARLTREAKASLKRLAERLTDAP
jgi:RNA polymerase sigma factor (sigma-70 family)